MQSLSAGINRQRDNIIEQGDFNRKVCSGLRQFHNRMSGEQFVSDGLFHHSLTGGNARQLRLDGFPFDDKGSIRRYKLMPWQSVSLIVKLPEISRLETTDTYQNSFGATQEQITTADSRRFTGEHNSPRLNRLSLITELL